MKYHYICTNLSELIPNENVTHSTIDIMLEDLTNNPIVKGNNRFISADTETEGWFDFKNKILSIQLGNTENLYFIAIQYITLEELKKLVTWLNTIDYIFIFHNAKFDLKFLSTVNAYPKKVYCTYVIEMYIHSSDKKDKGFYSLQGLVERYFNVYLDKTVRGKINNTTINDTEVIYYSLGDIKYLDKILEKQLGILNTYNSLHPQIDLNNILNIDTIVGLENRVIPALVEAELTGIDIDWTAYYALKNEFVPLYLELLNKIKEVVINCDKLRPALMTATLFGLDYKVDSKGKLFNWASPLQKLKALQILFPEIESCDTHVLQSLQGSHPIIELLIEFSVMFKLKTSFIDVLPGYVNSITGRIHSNINQLVSTGRMSMDNPNLQQIPRKGNFGKLLRALFTPQKNCSFVGGDFSSCELAIIANNSKDKLWIDTLKNKGDLHGILASKTFDIDIKDVKTPTKFNADITYRDVQKSIDFGLAYGMGPDKLANVMCVAKDLAQNVIDKFFYVVPAVKKYLDSSGKFAIKNHYAVTNAPYNRIRKFFNLSKGARERAGKNAPIQGTNADIIKRAIIDLYEFKLNNPTFSTTKLILFVHDEIICNSPTETAEAWLNIQKTVMMLAASISVPLLQIDVDIKVMDKWQK